MSRRWRNHLFSIAFLSAILIHPLIRPGLGFAQVPITVETKDGRSYSCTFSHEVETRERKYFLCRSSEALMILAREPLGWIAVEKEQNEPYPKEVHAFSVKDGSEDLYIGSTPPGVTYGTLTARIHSLTAVLSLLAPPAEGQDQISISEDFEHARATLYRSANAEQKRILKRAQTEASIVIELSNGQTIQCRRGKPRSAQWYGECDFFKCENVSLGGNTYEALLHFQEFPNHPTITLSQKETLGPWVSVQRVYLGARTPDNLYLDTSGSSTEFPIQPDFKQQFPEKLKHLDKTLLNFYRPFFSLSRQTALHDCSDPEIDRLIHQEDEAFEKTKEIIARTETAQMISWADGILNSRLIPKTNIPENACKLASESYIRLETEEKLKNFQEWFVGSFDQTVSPREAERIFETVLEMDDIPFEYIQDGCYARAHVIADRLGKAGVQTQKVWAVGDLSPIKNPEVKWSYHVAPVIQVRQENGNIEKMVIDPSLSSELISVEKWLSLMKDPKSKWKVTSFPPPRNGSFFQTTTISYSPSSVFTPYVHEFKRPSSEAALERALMINAKNRGERGEQ